MNVTCLNKNDFFTFLLAEKMEQFSHLFIANTILSKLDLEKNFHILVIGWLIYNYFPFQKYKKKFELWWDPPRKEVQKNSVYFELLETNYTSADRSPHYQAIMDYIRELPSIHRSKSVFESTEKISIYEVCQDDTFLLEKELKIYGFITQEDLSGGEKNDLRRKTYLEIYSYHSSHKEITKWIDQVHDKWDTKQKKKYSGPVKRIWHIYKNPVYSEIHSFMCWSQTAVSFDNTFFPGRDLLIKELDNFKQREETWDNADQPWQFGIALTGDKGTGKTRILKCIARYMKRHLFMVNLANDFPIEQLEKVMHGVFPGVGLRCDEFIIVFEEIADQTDLVGPRDEKPVFDKGASGEERMEDKKRLNKRKEFMSKFLPLIDGVNERIGGMMIMTTNFVERLDPALLRPGRIDYHLHLTGGYDRRSTWQVIKHYWKEKISDFCEEDLKDEIVGKYNGSELAQKCRAMDLDEFKEHFFKLEEEW